MVLEDSEMLCEVAMACLHIRRAAEEASSTFRTGLLLSSHCAAVCLLRNDSAPVSRDIIPALETGHPVRCVTRIYLL